MPDITMCVNVHCPMRKFCYRYRAKPDERWQSFSEFEPTTRQGRDEIVMECENFWSAERYPKETLSPLEEADKRNMPKPLR